MAQGSGNPIDEVPSEVSGLIFDLGLHQGYDSRFYLNKSFRVVGLEAVPALCASAAKRLAHFGDRITIVNKALYSKSGEKVTFYSVPDKDDWGSLVQGNAGKGVYETVAFEVDTIDLAKMFDLYGTPHYIKCDLEGADRTFVAQLAKESRRPTFVSVEINHEDDIDLLERCGYEVGQIVNQAMNIHVVAPNPAREGVYVKAHFDGETSGLFGRELPPEKWRPLAEVRQMYIDWRSLKERDDNLAPGWLDIHVCKRSALQ
ncbi:hypothetical protein GCM10010520_51000 [Rhizobium viscosum]